MSNVTMTKKDAELLPKLHALVGSDNAKEAEAARKKLVELLKKYGLSWNHLPDLLRGHIAQSDAMNEEEKRRASAAEYKGKVPDALSLVHRILEYYLDLKPHEYVALALWICHTHVYAQFPVTPRLMLMSPSNGCGKTTVLGVINRLSRDPTQTSNITPSALFRFINEWFPTMLLDEGDNLGLLNNPILRSVINCGHEKSSSNVTRTVGHNAQQFDIFCPLAIAAIGTLPVPLMKRSIIIRMERTDRTDLRRLGVGDQAMFDTAFVMLREWSAKAQLDLDPPMGGLRNRSADNWRVLFAIADSFGAEWGQRAREAAHAFSQFYTDEDVAILLLKDCRNVFDQRCVDRISSDDLIAALVESDHNWSWSAYQGPRDDLAPKKLTQGEFARLLRPFGVRSKSMRFKGEDGTRKGYARETFERAWARYCPEDGTPAQPSNVKYLHQKQAAH